MAEQSTGAHAAANELPLTGVRILEFGHTVMGPSCSMVLADLGVGPADPALIGDVDADSVINKGSGIANGDVAAAKKTASDIQAMLK